jgi:3',5'-cyclic-AMP phosphodiesterase
MKFVIIADIHLGPNERYFQGILRQINKEAKKLIKDFVEQVQEIKPDFVVVLGDLVEDDGAKNDSKNIIYIIEALKEIDCPIYCVAGNHDLKNLSEEELAQLFQQDKLYYSFAAGDFHCIVLFSKAVKGEGSTISDEQVKWLEDDLRDTNKNCLVFVHHGLADQDLNGNPWFEGRPDACLIKNREKVRSVLENSQKVLGVFNSHLHWNKMNTHNSIPYFTIQSLTENEENKGLVSQAYAIVDVSDKEIGIEIKGNYPKSFSFKK